MSATGAKKRKHCEDYVSVLANSKALTRATLFWVPSGKPTVCYGKSQSLIGKSTMNGQCSIAIIKLPEGRIPTWIQLEDPLQCHSARYKLAVTSGTVTLYSKSTWSPWQIQDFPSHECVHTLQFVVSNWLLPNYIKVMQVSRHRMFL